MNSKTIVFLVLLTLLTKSTFGGCLPPKLRTSHGVECPNYPTQKPMTVIYVSAPDSFIVMVGSRCQSLNKLSVIFDGDTITSTTLSPYSQGFSIKLPEKGGLYEAICSSWLEKFHYLFMIQISPVGIATLTQNNLSVQIFPNPAKDFIQVSNSSENIKSIKIKELSGRLLYANSFNQSTIELPIENYPPGIYFVEVTTLADKVEIKKLVVK
jgi:hypothetical protein